MSFLVAAGVITAVGFWLILMRFDRKAVSSLRTPLDIVFSIGMFLMFFGTFSGMVAAAVGALVFTILLNITKAVYGTRKFFTRRK